MFACCRKFLKTVILLIILALIVPWMSTLSITSLSLKDFYDIPVYYYNVHRITIGVNYRKIRRPLKILLWFSRCIVCNYTISHFINLFWGIPLILDKSTTAVMFLFAAVFCSLCLLSACVCVCAKAKPVCTWSRHDSSSCHNQWSK